jgi:hypothetical protein
MVILLSVSFIVPGTHAASDLEGVWLTHGYGMLIEINGDQTNVYDLTPVSCVLLFDNAALQAYGLQFTLENGELIIRDDLTLYFAAARLDALPDRCANGGTQSDDPELNFEAFWNDFNEQYAFFDLHGVDWQAQYDHYRPLVTAATTPNELFAILSDMVRPLDDDHLTLSNGVDDFAPAALPTWISDRDSLAPTMIMILDVIAQNYLKADISVNLETASLQGDETRIANRLIFYGRLSDTVGYINILAETAYTDGGDDAAAAEAAMDRIVAEFADLDTVILDTRLNTGGEDGIALILASRFADQKRLVCTKQARDGSGFTPAREFYVEPGGPQQFTKNVIVLTSQFTVSAGETLILALDVLPNVTMIGEKTAGAYSDMLLRVLPNGWQFTMSNEVYTSADGDIYEKVGNPPDIEIPLDVASFQAGKDTMLDAALELAAQG